MSVINKMLRDLDHRAGPSVGAQGASPAASALRQGTASVSIGTLATHPPSAQASRWWLGLGVLTALAASLGGWFWWSAATSGAPVEVATTTAVVPSATPSSVAAPTAAIAAATPASSADVASEPGVASTVNVPVGDMQLRMESSLSARQALDALLSKPTPPPAPLAQRAVASASSPVSSPAVATAVATSATSAPTSADRPKARTAVSNTATGSASTSESTPTIQRQQQAGGDALAQAQSLWNSGSHDAAIELMQQSIAAAERGAKAGATGGTSGANGAVLVPLVREMARMQLAEARYGAVWEMLTRLEPLLGNQADLWAIRANAAQRLGRHPDSVHAYMMALQSRPDEQRWLLGTAVSLAALGQTSSAAEMAEKARAVGPVSKDVLAYLRQTGVPLRGQ